MIIQECPLGTQRCGTGDCLSVCPEVNGCNVNEGEGPTGDCVALEQADYTGESDFFVNCPLLEGNGGR